MLASARRNLPVHTGSVFRYTIAMKRFFQTIKFSLTSRAFYQRILNGSEPMGFKYFFWLNALYSVIIALVLIPMVLLLVSPDAHAKFLSIIPADLTITLDRGKISINQPEPYIIPTQKPEDIQKCGTDQKCLNKVPANAVVIDTKTPFSVEQFDKYNTLVLVKDSMIVGKKSGGQIEIIPNPKDVHLELNRNWAASLLVKYSWIAWFIPVAALVGSITILYVFNLFGYLLWALLVWGILWVYGVKTSFGKSYSVVLYTSIIFMLFDIASFFVAFTQSNWFQFIVIVIFLYYMIKKGVEPIAEKGPEEKSKSGVLPVERITDEDTNNGTK